MSKPLRIAIGILAIGIALFLYRCERAGVNAEKQPQPSPSNTPVATESPAATAIHATATPKAVSPPPGPPVPKQEIKQRMESQMKLWYLTPISVYGRVIDETGNPVAGASVMISVADKLVEGHSDYVETTDHDGYFSLTGAHGAGFNVVASKRGYYSFEKSKGKRNVVVPGNVDLPESSKDNPIILVLRKRGAAEPLLFAETGQVNMPNSGQSVNVDLTTGLRVAGGPANLQAAARIGDTNHRPFDWHFELSIPGGGLIERTGSFAFEAPKDGYAPSVEVNMPAVAEKWSNRAEMEYFAKLPDGRYARFTIRFHPGQRTFVVIESYVNPQPGSRNLEYDPAKQLNPH